MPAPTALKKAQDAPPAADIQLPEVDLDQDLVLETGDTLPTLDVMIVDAEAIVTEDAIDEEGRPKFGPAKDLSVAARVQNRQVRIPPHRMTPLKSQWPRIYPPLVEHLKLQVRMNVKRKAVELRTSKHTTDPEAIQRGVDFLTAFVCGFDVDDAIALLRLDDLYIEGDHLARAIGRIAGKDGKTKFAIENATKTRIVLADTKIHILGGYKNVQIARASVCNLIMGKQPGKVYNSLRAVAARMKERF
ncbi:hypothetical protein jhhlp_002400 [Lomentospora prolificans]|uniref:Pre-rRNA-processing protein PNO1 n=1 Tax=Lomentospora prolificans TaxID=41688 RepID=A0A2N3NDX4_9PEZI|nr:hypothetical protein jhhlp_002400 [Lomentospora prolificans]